MGPDAVSRQVVADLTWTPGPPAGAGGLLAWCGKPHPSATASDSGWEAGARGQGQRGRETAGACRVQSGGAVSSQDGACAGSGGPGDLREVGRCGRVGAEPLPSWGRRTFLLRGS